MRTLFAHAFRHRRRYGVPHAGRGYARQFAYPALMHAANHVFEMVGPLLAAQFMDDDPPAWLPRTLGCATMDEYLALMPDARIVHEARLNALATGEPQRVFLKDAGVEIAVTPTGEVTV